MIYTCPYCNKCAHEFTKCPESANYAFRVEECDKWFKVANKEVGYAFAKALYDLGFMKYYFYKIEENE